MYAVERTEHDALVKSMTKILSSFVAFSENPNFKIRPMIDVTGLAKVSMDFARSHFEKMQL